MYIPLAPVDWLQGPSNEESVPIAISIAYINCVGQSKFPVAKQLEIQSFICSQKLDIIHLQECKIDEDSFSNCGLVTNNFNIFSNNKHDESFYGTASLVRSDLEVTKIHTDDDRRVIVFDAAGCTWANFYLPCGSGHTTRASRENYCSLIIPQLMIRKLSQGAAGGDFNSIIDLKDSVKFPHNKISPLCKNLIRAFSWSDSFCKLHPRDVQYSRYQGADGEGATRIDRSYHWGSLQVSDVAYLLLGPLKSKSNLLFTS